MTTSLYDAKAPKRATNLSVNADLLRQARRCGINLSRLLERHLIEELRKRRTREWLTENEPAIVSYNQRVERRGVFGDGLRRF